MQEVSNILNPSNLLSAAYYSIPLIGAVALAAYFVIEPHREGLRMVRELNDHYSDDMPLEELSRIYNDLLPNARSIHGKNIPLADELVEKIELRLCQQITQECQAAIGTVPKTLTDLFLQSPTFNLTFANHHYAGRPNPEDAIMHVLGLMNGQDFMIKPGSIEEGMRLVK